MCIGKLQCEFGFSPCAISDQFALQSQRQRVELGSDSRSQIHCHTLSAHYVPPGGAPCSLASKPLPWTLPWTRELGQGCWSQCGAWGLLGTLPAVAACLSTVKPESVPGRPHCSHTRLGINILCQQPMRTRSNQSLFRRDSEEGGSRRLAWQKRCHRRIEWEKPALVALESGFGGHKSQEFLLSHGQRPALCLVGSKPKSTELSEDKGRGKARKLRVLNMSL